MPNCPHTSTPCKHIGNEVICRKCPHKAISTENLINRFNSTNKKPAKSKVNKYKQQIDLIFMALKQDVVKEYKFHPTRKWRFDWALEEIKVAVEYQGLNFQTPGEASGHQTIKGITAENEKLSEATIMGWCVVLVDAESVDSGLAHDLIRRAVESRSFKLHDIPGIKRNRLTGGLL